MRTRAGIALGGSADRRTSIVLGITPIPPTPIAIPISTPKPPPLSPRKRSKKKKSYRHIQNTTHARIQKALTCGPRKTPSHFSSIKALILPRFLPSIGGSRWGLPKHGFTSKTPARAGKSFLGRRYTIPPLFPISKFPLSHCPPLFRNKFYIFCSCIERLFLGGFGKGIFFPHGFFPKCRGLEGKMRRKKRGGEIWTFFFSI